jgi:hypothetical protein
MNLHNLRRKKGSGPICRNGPKGASHKLDLTPFSWTIPPGVVRARPAADRKPHHSPCPRAYPNVQHLSSAGRSRQSAHANYPCRWAKYPEGVDTVDGFSGQTLSGVDATGSRNVPGRSVPRVATRTCGWGRPRATAAGWTGGPSRLEVMGIVHEAGSSPGRTDCTGWSLKKRHPLIQRADVGTLSLHLGTLVLQGPAHLLLRTIIRVVVVEGPFISAKEIEIRAEHRLCGAVAGKLSTRRLTGTKQNHTGRQARQGYL